MSGAASTPGLVGTRLGLALLVAGLIVAAWLRISRPVVLGQATEAAGRFETSLGMRIDLNEATGAEVTLLPGVGPRLAQRIREDRAEHGPFGTVDDLARVPGVGRGIVERIRPYAAARPRSGSEPRVGSERHESIGGPTGQSGHIDRRCS